MAILLRLLAGADYLLATIRGTVKPNPVTWLFWGLSPMIAFAAQVQYGLQPSSWVTFVLGMGPLLIFAITITKNKRQRWKVGPFDILCGACAFIGIILWQVTSDPVLALTFGILADIIGGIPTVYKAYVKPQTEKALPYFLSMLSMIVTMLTIRDWSYVNVGFTMYIFCINTVIATLVAAKVGARVKKRRKRRVRSVRR
ncbi:hypothetical protein PV379_00415 [Streptomyces caniscabiei]|uniref:hypothetical protein n=1 Tax=Streptomyces caniscabiei TaxID=2746961 RepID=UPI0029B54F45|nr:hypothetical protein [Streptomyces caniscabiei]MDX2775819.1 hypothetical protein [Streptomyces caniscabiei]